VAPQVRAPYRSAHIFFSSPVPPVVLEAIRSCPLLVGALRSLKEVRAAAPRVRRPPGPQRLGRRACGPGAACCSVEPWPLKRVTTACSAPRVLALHRRTTGGACKPRRRARARAHARRRRQVNHEFVVVDARTFLTSEQQSLQVRRRCGERGHPPSVPGHWPGCTWRCATAAGPGTRSALEGGVCYTLYPIYPIALEGGVC